MLKRNTLLLLFVAFFKCQAQEYDFGAEIKRQCLVPDPVGLLDCVENRVTLPYLTSWIDCTNSLGENVRTSADVINYRCKSVWEGKEVIPEVFYIADCVVEKTGLPRKNVSAEILGAYKECESTSPPTTQQIQRTKSLPLQQQQVPISAFEYRPPSPVQYPAPIPAAPLQYPIPIQQSQYQIQQRNPYSRQYFVLYPQLPLPGLVGSQQLSSGAAYVPQQPIKSFQSVSVNVPQPSGGGYSYSYQIQHP